MIWISPVYINKATITDFRPDESSKLLPVLVNQIQMHAVLLKSILIEAWEADYFLLFYILPIDYSIS